MPKACLKHCLPHTIILCIPCSAFPYKLLASQQSCFETASSLSQKTYLSIRAPHNRSFALITKNPRLPSQIYPSVNYTPVSMMHFHNWCRTHYAATSPLSHLDSFSKVSRFQRLSSFTPFIFKSAIPNTWNNQHYYKDKLWILSFVIHIIYFQGFVTYHVTIKIIIIFTIQEKTSYRLQFLF